MQNTTHQKLFFLLVSAELILSDFNFIKETHLSHICIDNGLNGTFVNRMCPRYLFIVGSQKLYQRGPFKLKVMNSKGKGKDSTQHKSCEKV